MGKDRAGPGMPQGESAPPDASELAFFGLSLPWSVSLVLNHLTAFGLDRTITGN